MMFILHDLIEWFNFEKGLKEGNGTELTNPLRKLIKIKVPNKSIIN